MSFKPQVLVEGSWSGNGLVFATHTEALENAKDLMRRWILVEDVRVVETSALVNYAWINGTLKSVGPSSENSG